MATRVTLGSTGLSVSPVCYGSWQLSPRFWGKQPEDEVSGAMRKAFDVGVNFYDTADAYGEGYAEEVLGRALKDLPRKELVVATKVFWHMKPDGSRYGDLSKAYILEACDASLKRLGMDYVDLYQCHSWDPLAQPEETADALETLKKQGKIRHYGVSNWTVEQTRLGRKHGTYESHQPFYSLIKREIERDLLPYCQQENIGTLVYSPLHNGLLSGKYKGAETFDDFRKNHGDFKGERFVKLCEAVQKLGEIASSYSLTTVQLVVVATLMHPGITSAIVGIKTPKQIEEAAGAMGKTISREDWNKVRALVNV
ncbi:MAG: aldo/keto reductase [Planctomycetota bacterium]|nr:aldo/keto reductase [Planctomycetota bacterium]